MQKFDYIYTHSGIKFHFMHPVKEEIIIGDIAHALSNICRYSGQCNEFYSVAEHCVILANKTFEISNDPNKALYALLHDSSEAYILDMPRPIKPFLNDYVILEKNITEVINNKFNIKENALVLYLDTNIVRDEAQQLFNPVPKWCDCYEKININLKKLSPKNAKIEFMLCYNKFNDLISDKSHEHS